MADELGFAHVTLGVMLGKAVKLAAGSLDTHSRKTVMDKDFIRRMLREATIDTDISDITLARELWERIPKEKMEDFCNTVIQHCRKHCEPLLPNGRLTLLLIADDGTIHPQ
jgi:cobalt-precorrin-5B (C1)-methyltransferase